MDSDSEDSPCKYLPFHLGECEDLENYEPGGFHPVHLGDVYHGHYRVVHKLGFGGFSTVWLARLTITNRWVALKIVAARESPTYRDRSVIASHPSIAGSHLFAIADHEFWIDGPNGRHLCLVCPVLGADLSSLSKSIYSRVKPAFARDVSLQATRALVHLHSNGLCHGVVHDHRPAAKATWYTGKVPGAGSRGRTGRKPASDIWALGCAIFRIRSGEDHFFDYDTDCPADALRQIVKALDLGELPEDWRQTRFDEEGLAVVDGEGGELFWSLKETRPLEDRVRAIMDEPPSLFINSLGEAVEATDKEPEAAMFDDDAEVREPYAAALSSMVWRPTAVCVDRTYVTTYSDEEDDMLDAFPRISEPEASLLVDLLSKIFTYDPATRPKAEELVPHPWFHLAAASE